MNVLMVSSNQNFCLCLKENLSNSSKIKQFYLYNDFDDFCNSDIVIGSKDLVFIDLELSSQQLNKFILSLKNNNIIGLSSNNKTLLKYLNFPIFLKIYKFPIKINELLEYLNRQFNLFESINITSHITSKLCNLGFNLSHQGTIYLIECIDTAINDERPSIKDLYDKVANRHKTSSNIVKWAIMNAVNSAYRSINEEKMEKFFMIYDKRKPTPKFIIDFFAKTANLW